MIVSVGEVVWDIFDDRQVLGGAPVNVAYHLHELGMEVRVITGIGRDPLGIETKKKIGDLGLPLEGVQEVDLPTGKVRVTIGANNDPRFEIVAPAAWDAIDMQQAMALIEDKPFHLVFGTLAQRDRRSRQTIRALWDKAETCFYDVNLRPPFTTKELVFDSLGAADMVKVNADELRVLAGWQGITGDDKQDLAQSILARFVNITVLVVTEGPQGAWLVTRKEFYTEPGIPVEVADTVGAGDAFFATIIEGYIDRRPWPVCLARANRRGAYVASQHGATPPMPEQITT